MFTKSETEAKLDAEILAALKELSSKERDSEEYGALLDRIAKLHKLKVEERPKRISPDTALVVAANVFGILWLAAYEREHVIKAPNAMKLVMKPR